MIYYIKTYTDDPNNFVQVDTMERTWKINTAVSNGKHNSKSQLSFTHGCDLIVTELAGAALVGLCL